MESTEREMTKTIVIEPGQATVLWQWTIEMVVNNVAVRIPTDLTWTTTALDEVPPIPATVSNY